jgi:hypothetical protein
VCAEESRMWETALKDLSERGESAACDLVTVRD